jgi:hypothetical protein
MPGHVTSWVVGYPELASAPGPYQIERRFGVFDAAFDPTRESTYKFIEGFIGEMVKIFPDPYWHIGGDENNGKQWAANPRIQAFSCVSALSTRESRPGAVASGHVCTTARASAAANATTARRRFRRATPGLSREGA